ncbi:MAG: hypothetical protein J6C28_02130 [Bacilli bacterium]|nr:hypothetical protein [Bacilli bacterium]
MEELYIKLDNLKLALDETKTIQEIKRLTKKISKNKELLELIEKYNYTQDERIKEKIISNEEFMEYKQQETELNLLILEINQELKKITKKDKCGL